MMKKLARNTIVQLKRDIDYPTHVSTGSRHPSATTSPVKAVQKSDAISRLSQDQEFLEEIIKTMLPILEDWVVFHMGDDSKEDPNIKKRYDVMSAFVMKMTAWKKENEGKL